VKLDAHIADPAYFFIQMGFRIMSTMLKISDIKQFPRDGVDNDRVNRYAKMLQNGVNLDAVVVFRRNGSDKYELYHGRHRYFAYLALNRAEIPVVFVSAPIKPDSRRGQARRSV
jgi:hypothetical protein